MPRIGTLDVGLDRLAGEGHSVVQAAPGRGCCTSCAVHAVMCMLGMLWQAYCVKPAGSRRSCQEDRHGQARPIDSDSGRPRGQAHAVLCIRPAMLWQRLAG
jgi:hypothetical protein